MRTRWYEQKGMGWVLVMLALLTYIFPRIVLPLLLTAFLVKYGKPLIKLMILILKGLIAFKKKNPLG